ncbi:MAG TPA: hypothetical protein VHY08_14160 [Bacillota bacterium]|nr:hypothetical protein [Bacillota bacterium]
MIFKNLVLSNTIPKKPDSFYAWAAFIAFYSWFNLIFFNFNTSPPEIPCPVNGNNPGIGGIHLFYLFWGG